MKNKQAKNLMLGNITTDEIGEVSILNEIRIYAKGSSLAFKTYIGVVDEPSMLSEVHDFCKRLNLPRKAYRMHG